MAFSATAMGQRDHDRVFLLAERIRRLMDDPDGSSQSLLWLSTVIASTCWFVTMILLVSLGWATGQWRLALEVIGALFVLSVSCVAAIVALYVAVTTMSRSPARAETELTALALPAHAQLPEILALSPLWNRRRAARALTRFMDGFDVSLAALRARLSDALPGELGATLPLHQQIATARDLGIWDAQDETSWRQCLAMRTAIFTEGAAFSTATVDRHAQWLVALAVRTHLPSFPPQQRQIS